MKMRMATLCMLFLVFLTACNGENTLVTQDDGTVLTQYEVEFLAEHNAGTKISFTYYDTTYELSVSADRKSCTIYTETEPINTSLSDSGIGNSDVRFSFTQAEYYRGTCSLNEDGQEYICVFAEKRIAQHYSKEFTDDLRKQAKESIRKKAGLSAMVNTMLDLLDGKVTEDPFTDFSRWDISLTLGDDIALNYLAQYNLEEQFDECLYYADDYYAKYRFLRDDNTDRVYNILIDAYDLQGKQLLEAAVQPGNIWLCELNLDETVKRSRNFITYDDPLDITFSISNIDEWKLEALFQAENLKLTQDDVSEKTFDENGNPVKMVSYSLLQDNITYSNVVTTHYQNGLPHTEVCSDYYSDRIYWKKEYHPVTDPKTGQLLVKIETDFGENGEMLYKTECLDPNTPGIYTAYHWDYNDGKVRNSSETKYSNDIAVFEKYVEYAANGKPTFVSESTNYPNGNPKNHVEYNENGEVISKMDYPDQNEPGTYTWYSCSHESSGEFFIFEGELIRNVLIWNKETYYSANGEFLSATKTSFYPDGSTKSSTEYDENGEIYLKTEYSQQTTPGTYTATTYEHSGSVLVNVTEQKYVDYSPSFSRWTAYDTNGGISFILETTAFHPNGYPKTTVQYDEYGNVIYTHEYDANGNLIK